MKIRILFFLMLASTFAYGQNYHPMLKDTKWYINTLSFNISQNTWIIPLNDTVIFSKKYTMFIDTASPNNIYFIREDTTTMRIYRFKNNADTLMIDFSLKLGDSIKLENNLFYKVINVSTFNVNGGSRKSLTLTTYIGGMPFRSQTWLESVGHSSFPLKPKYELPSDPSYSIICNYQQGNVLFGFNNLECPAMPVTVSLQDSKVIHEVVFPNPFSLQLNVELQNNEQTTILLHDFLGQQVLQQTFTKYVSINTEQLESGIYIFELRNSKGKIKAGKIIKLN